MALLAKRSALPFTSSTKPARRHVSNVAVSSYGGRNGLILGGNDNSNQRPGSLIIPGQSPSPGYGQRLVVPDDGRSSQGAPGAGGASPVNKFRPPPGFMNETIAEDTTVNLRPEDMLNRLRAGGGKWHQLAKFIPSLNNKGFDGPTIEGLTGITPATQNKMVVAATVHDSMVASNKVPPEVMEYFDYGGEELLHPFRFLSAERRVAAALYIYMNRLDPTQCEVLARAMKEWERRPEERKGFTDSPADCMAFKHLRDALECRKPEDMMAKVQLGLTCAESDGARARLQQIAYDQQQEQVEESSKAQLLVLKLEPEELGFRPIPQVATYGKADAMQVLSAPKASQSGPFGSFTLSPGATACPWVALPQWRALALARHPVALAVEDCASVAQIVAGTRSKAAEDRKRLSGPGLLVVDILGEGAILEEQFYLVAGPGNMAVLADGATVVQRGAEVLALVMFLARPPVRDSVAASATDLLSL